MTWQRIDEDTYIDDTLVTCAEYQLFIDEMHEQGKYYKPDHWTSYQFSGGQAHEPILGIRHRDAITFCRWLAKHENANWYYRLPTREEARSFPLRIFLDRILGYWLNEDNQFEWIGLAPKNPRNIKIDIAFFRDVASDGTKAGALDLNNLVGQSNSQLIEGMLARDLSRKLKLDTIIEQILDQISSLDYSTLIIQDLEMDVDVNPSRDGRNHALDTYIDLFTLQERIAGRSLAFEGIRLVKERIK